ncbi:MAG TPA: quinolinate synthase NadA [Phycisphaerae bacterium]|nr:quinolinate synthase NadA [Phycisphaerales bacterium]HRX87341.1 quinolinate synthase NadA [Phycisphaerae bacterium]
MLFQPPLPAKYLAMTDADLAAQIERHRARFGERLVILGHHYQQDDVIRFADFTGDSLKLSQIAAAQDAAEFVVFCGVHFMAESADILTDDRVQVFLPDLSAGCSMADMAAYDQVEEAWDFLTAATSATIVPITYVNSAANIKAFCGLRGGACCTSSNAAKVLAWALAHGSKVLFLPDQHLGRNTAYALGHPLDTMVVYDPAEPDGGLTAEQVRDAQFILWKGHCSVHQLFTATQCDALRAQEPDRTILVHPECAWEVVQKADLAGSTEFIIHTVEHAPAGSKWAIGTEVHLVNRLAKAHPDKDIRSLSPIQCLCTTMYRISPPHLLWCLDALAAGHPVNRIQVLPTVRDGALMALQRMLDNVSATPVAVAGSTA